MTGPNNNLSADQGSFDGSFDVDSTYPGPDRMRRIRQEMAQRGVEALVVSGSGTIGSYAALEFVGGYAPLGRAGACVVWSSGPITIFASSDEEADYVRRLHGHADVVVSRTRRCDGEVGGTARYPILDLLKERVGPGSRIAEIDRGVSHWRLAESTNRFCWIEGSEILTAVAIKPGLNERRAFEWAHSTATFGMRRFHELTSPGAAVAKIVSIVDAEVRALGARHPIITLGRGPFFQHRPSSSDVVRESDLRTAYVEVGGPWGSWVEVISPIMIGKPDPNSRRMEQAAHAALEAAVHALRGDAPAAEVAQAARDVADRRGLRVASTDIIGHGVGIGDRGLGTISSQSPGNLLLGAPVALHPTLIADDGQSAVTAGDTFLVGEIAGVPIPPGG